MELKSETAKSIQYIADDIDEILLYRDSAKSKTTDKTKIFYFKVAPKWEDLREALVNLPLNTKLLWVICKRENQRKMEISTSFIVRQIEDAKLCKSILFSSHQKYFMDVAASYENEIGLNSIREQMDVHSISENAFFVANSEDQIFGGVLFVNHINSDGDVVKYVGWIWIEREISGIDRKIVMDLLKQTIDLQNPGKLYAAIYASNDRSIKLALSLGGEVECVVF